MIPQLVNREPVARADRRETERREAVSAETQRTRGSGSGSGARTERRRYQRHALRCECWLEGDDVTIFGPTIDVGIGGLFLRTAIPVASGAQVDVTLKVSGEPPLSARAVITRIVPARTGLRHGVAVEFLEIHQGRGAFGSLLQQTPPLPWG